MPLESSQQTPSAQRIPAIDAWRGLALVGMFVFHIIWDLGYFHLIPESFPYSPGFMAFGHAVALTFLGLAGASLALADRNGVNWRAYWRRMGMIAAAAAMITVATLYLFPESYIFFGILHCIAAASLLALIFLRAPVAITLAAACLMAAAPLLYESAALDNVWGWSLGLAADLPRTNDWRPLLPWGGATLAGLALMRLALARGLPAAFSGWSPRSTIARSLSWGGRHSLLVYLVHQPLFFGAVWAAAIVVGPLTAESSPEYRFMRDCERQCVGVNDERSANCARLCACVSGRVREANGFTTSPGGSSVRVGREQVRDWARQCVSAREP